MSGNKDVEENKAFSSITKEMHAGYKPEIGVNPVDVPKILTSTYCFKSAQACEDAFKDALENGNFNNELIYSRVGHAPGGILQERLVNIEKHGGDTAVFGSGMAAIHTAIMALCPRDKVIAYTTPLYGGTFHLFNAFLKPVLGYKLVELSCDTEVAWEQIIALGDNLGVVYIETPGNPTLEMHDIDMLATAGKEANPESYSILDNTFMGVFQNGFEISGNLDFIVYSGTKFLGGHSDVLSGVVVCHEKNIDVMKNIKSLRVLFGNILHPYECGQLITHLCTYDLRMRKQAENAEKIAQHFKTIKHPKIQKILHPSLFDEGTKEFELYKKQCTGGSSLIAFWLNSDKAGAFRFLDKMLESGIVFLAVSLGSVETLASHPASSTHSEMDKETLERFNITDNLVRFSVGIENYEDLITVITNALEVV